jgi:isoleucyl-tRNA synthetase
LSAFYFDVLKDRLYTKARKNKSRRSAQTAVWKIADALVRLVAPVLVFTAEEIWKYLPKQADAPSSVHMALFSDANELSAGIAPALVDKWETLARIRSEVLSALETTRNEKIIASALEAKVTLWPRPDLKQSEQDQLLKLLKTYASHLPALFIVSQVNIANIGASSAISKGGPNDLLAVTVQKADGKKCERCWNYSTHVGENPRYPTVCERCTEALAEIEADTSASAAVS